LSKQKQFCSRTKQQDRRMKVGWC